MLCRCIIRFTDAGCFNRNDMQVKGYVSSNHILGWLTEYMRKIYSFKYLCKAQANSSAIYVPVSYISSASTTKTEFRYDSSHGCRDSGPKCPGGLIHKDDLALELARAGHSAKLRNIGAISVQLTTSKRLILLNGWAAHQYER